MRIERDRSDEVLSRIHDGWVLACIYDDNGEYNCGVYLNLDDNGLGFGTITADPGCDCTLYDLALILKTGFTEGWLRCNKPGANQLWKISGVKELSEAVFCFLPNDSSMHYSVNGTNWLVASIQDMAETSINNATGLVPIDAPDDRQDNESSGYEDDEDAYFSDEIGDLFGSDDSDFDAEDLLYAAPNSNILSYGDELYSAIDYSADEEDESSRQFMGYKAWEEGSN